MKKKFEIIRSVLDQVENMYNNNLTGAEEGWCDFYETFEGWCEDGDVFDPLVMDECTKLMKEIAPHVDEITEILGEYIDNE